MLLNKKQKTKTKTKKMLRPMYSTCRWHK